MRVNAGYKDILQVAFPVMIGSLANNVVMVIDTAFLNRVGEAQQAAAGLAAVLYFILIMTGVGLMNGMQIMIGRRAGEGNDDVIGKVFQQGFLLSISFSVVFFFVVWLTGDTLIHILVKPDLAPYAHDFIQARKYGLLFGVFNTFLIAFYVGISHTQINYYSTVLIAIVNIVLDYIFIFGHYGVPAMGTAGAAYATDIAEGVGTLVLVVYILISKFHIRYHLMRHISLHISMIRSIVHLSLPVVFQYFISLTSWFFFFASLQKSGTHALAISNNLKSLYMFAAIPCWAFGTAANTMVSNLIGQNRQHDVLSLIRKAATLNFAFISVLCLLLVIYKYPILHLYTDNPTTITDSYPSLYSIVLALLVAGIAIVHLQGVTGSGSTGFALKTELAAVTVYIIHVLITAYWLHTALAIIWLAEVLYFTVTLVLNYRYLHTMRWQHNRI